MVTSKFDYCNSVLQGVAGKDLERLQRVQNTLARVVTGSHPVAHAAHLLQSLHWLPIKFRMKIKIALLAFKILKTGQPSYLHSILPRSVPNRTLRSNQGSLLVELRVTTVAGSRAFTICAPRLWNSLPLSLRMQVSVQGLKQKLKTYPVLPILHKFLVTRLRSSFQLGSS